MHARFESPDDIARLKGRNFVLTGYALGGRSGVKGVEISLDAGKSWKPTDLFSNPSTEAWSFWRYAWSPKPGQYDVRLRAISGSGEVENEGPTRPFPDGATGQHVVKVEMV